MGYIHKMIQHMFGCPRDGWMPPTELILNYNVELSDYCDLVMVDFTVIEHDRYYEAVTEILCPVCFCTFEITDSVLKTKY